MRDRMGDQLAGHQDDIIDQAGLPAFQGRAGQPAGGDDGFDVAVQPTEPLPLPVRRRGVVLGGHEGTSTIEEGRDDQA
jgi:hypothetical protein